MEANEKAKDIQDYLKPKLRNINSRRKKILDGANHLDRYVKLRVLNNIKKAGAGNKMNKVLRKAHGRKEQMNKKIKGLYFNKWRDALPGLRKHDAATTIQKNLRSKNARDKVKRLRRRNEKIKYLTLKLFGKYLDKRKIAFAKWVAVVEREKCDESAKTIQKYIGGHYQNLRRNKAKDNLRKMFRMDVIKKIKDVLNKASKISGDRGAKLYHTLEDIYIRRPYNKLILAMKWIGKINLLRRIQPKIFRALRHHWLPYYMKRWYENTVADRDRKLIFLQNWFRARLLLWKKRAELRKAQLLKKYLMKLTNDRDLLLRIPFRYWHKVAQYKKLNTQAETVQKIWRGGTSRKNVRRLMAQKKMRDLLKKNLKQKVADKVKEANDKFAAPLRSALKNKKSNFEKRYCTNDIVDFANDALRNKYLLLLTGRSAFGDELSTLRRYFDKWRNGVDKERKAIVRMQS